MPRIPISRDLPRWRRYRRWEKVCKASSLQALTEKQSIKALEDLHLFAQALGVGAKYDSADLQKIRVLARVHALFGKVGR